MLHNNDLKRETDQILRLIKQLFLSLQSLVMKRRKNGFLSAFPLAPYAMSIKR